MSMTGHSFLSKCGLDIPMLKTQKRWRWRWRQRGTIQVLHRSVCSCMKLPGPDTLTPQHARLLQCHAVVCSYCQQCQQSIKAGWMRSLYSQDDQGCARHCTPVSQCMTHQLFVSNTKHMGRHANGKAMLLPNREALLLHPYLTLALGHPGVTCLLCLLRLPFLLLQSLPQGAGFRLHVLAFGCMAFKGGPGLLQLKVQLLPLCLTVSQTGL